MVDFNHVRLSDKVVNTGWFNWATIVKFTGDE